MAFRFFAVVIFTFVGFFAANFFVSDAHAEYGQVFVDWTNAGNSEGTFNFRVFRGPDTSSPILCDWKQFAFGPNSDTTGSSSYSCFDEVAAGAYTVQWEPVKPYAWDSRDWNCTDPVTGADALGEVIAGIWEFRVHADFRCYVPSVSPPGAFALTNTLTSCNGTAADVTFSWSQSSGATSYDIFWGTGGTIGGTADLNTTNLSATVGGFTPQTNITWRVRANKAGTNGTWSDGPWSFDTAGPCGSSSPPGAFNNSTQQADVTCYGTNAATINFKWTSSSNATGYYIYWTVDGTNPQNKYNSSAPPGYGADATTSGLSYSQDGFSLNKTVNFHIRSQNNDGSVWANSGYFSVNTNITCSTGGSSVTNDFELKGNNTTGSVTVSSGTNVNMVWTHNLGSPSSCGASSNPNTSAWNTSSNSTPSSASLRVNGTGHGVAVTATTTLTMSCNYASGNTPVSKTFTITISSGGAVPTPTPTPSSGGGTNYTLTVDKAGTGTGTVTSSAGDLFWNGNTGTASYASGTSVTLTAAEGTGSVFSGWQGLVCSGTASTCTFTMNSNWGVTANFDAGSTATYSCRWSPSSNVTPGTESSLTVTRGADPYNYSISPASGWAWTQTTSEPYRARFNTANTTFTFTMTNGSTGAFLASCTVSTGAAPPSNLSLSALPACATSSGYGLTFSWTGASSAGWWLNVDSNSDWDNNNDGIADADMNNDIPAGQVNQTWAPLFMPGVTYRWNIYYGDGSGTGAKFVIPVSVQVTNAQIISGSPAGGAGYTFSVPACPSNLSVTTPACSLATGYSATLDWSGSGTGWYVDISNTPNFATYWNKDVSGVSTTVAPAGFGPGNLVLLPNVTYYWRIYYGTPDTWTYPPSIGSQSPAPGTPFTVSGCIDLKARFVRPFPGNSGSLAPGDPISLKVRVKNIGNTASAPTKVGLWTGQSGETSLPNCPTPGGIPPQEQNIAALAQGGVTEVTFNFTAPNSPGVYVANAYVIPGCDQADIYWPNNATNTIDQVGVEEDADAPPGGFVYAVSVNAWFETQGADVGARNRISITKEPPAGKYVSNPPLAPLNTAVKPLLVTDVADSWINVNQGVKITGYTGPLMSFGAYSYLADRFKSKATSGRCTFTTLPAGLSLCGGNVTLGNDDAAITEVQLPAGVNAAWFIDGNLTITDNIDVPVNSTIAFIVSGDIKVKTNVNKIDGIYTTANTFADTTDDVAIQGPQLVVDGSVYASEVTLTRKLGGALCGTTCDNTLSPAESFRFDPKYLINLGSLLATPSISWREVAP